MGFSHFSGLNVGSGSNIATVLMGTVSIDPPSIAATSETDVSVTVAGALVGDSLVLNQPAAGITSGLAVVGSRVSAANTVTVRIRNNTAGALDQAAASWTYLIVRAG